MSSLRCVAIAALVVGSSSCTCRGTSLSGSHGELVVVLTRDAGEQLTSEATLTVPGVAMGDVGNTPVLLRNVGNGPLTITGSTRDGDSAFALTGVDGQTIEPSAELSATIAFSPPQEADSTLIAAPHQATFALALTGTRATENTASITVSGEGLARDCLVPASLDFGAVPPGERVSIPLVLENGKLALSTTTLGEVKGDDPTAFGTAQRSVDVPPGGRAEAPIWFAPTEERTYHGTILVSRGGTCAPATVALVGRGLAQAISWSPASLDFGKVPLEGTSRALAVTVTNQSNATLHVASAATSQADFVLAAGPTSVPAGGSATFSLTCKPASLGKLTGTFDFTLDTVPALGASVALKCQGGGPKILVTPNPLVMGPGSFTTPGAVAIIRRLSVQNLGSLPASASDTSANLLLGIDGKPPVASVVVSSSRTSPAEFEVIVPSSYDPSKGLPALPGSNTADLEVRFKPLGLGPKDADLLLYSNDALHPTTLVHLSAEAVQAVPCALQVSPALVSFGDTPRGASASRSIVLTNLTYTPCLVSGIDLTAGTAPGFSLGGLNQVTVPGGGQATVVVKLTVPADAAQGSTLHGYVRLMAPTGGDPMLVPLDARVTSCLVIAPTALSFGSTAVGCRSAELPLQLYDTCSTPLVLGSIDLLTGPFRVVTQAPIPPTGYLLDLGSYTFTIAFVPTGIGPVTGSVTLSVTEAGIPRTVVVPLSGKGTSSSSATDDWTQGQGDVDILFVVDDSCSMADEQTALATNFKSFIQHAQFNNANFHLGVTTTDIFAVNGALKGQPAFLTPATTNLEAEFSKRALVGTGGSGFEQPFEGLLRAVTPPQSTTTNQGFLREGVPLAAVIVTDAQEQSPKPVSSYLAQLRAAKGNRADLLNVSVVGPFTQPAGCSLDSTIDPGRYQEMIDATHGARGDICTTDWATDLDTLGKSVLGLNTRFPLTAVPAGSITVTVNGVATAGWTLDAATSTIIFSKPPAQSSLVSASYQTVCNAPP